MSVKSDLLSKIKEKVERKKQLSQEIAQRHNNVEEFILKMLDELDEVISSTTNTNLLDTPHFQHYYVGSIENRIRTIDSGASIQVSWDTPEPGVQPRVNGILVKWSAAYQKSTSCEPELFVDVINLLLR